MRAKLCVIVFLFAVFPQTHPPSSALAAQGTPTVSNGVSGPPAYTLRVKDHWMAHKTIKDLVLLLGGTAKSNVLKGKQPQTIRMELSLPQDQSAYFFSKLSGLGHLSPPPDGSAGIQGSRNSDVFRVSLDVFDP